MFTAPFLELVTAQMLSYYTATIARAYRKALDNLRAVLEASGSSLDRTLRLTVYLKNPADFAAMSSVYAEYFPKNKPARTTVPGVEWGPGVLIEIDAIAVRTSK